MATTDRAIILTAGEGKRLRPLTLKRPKSLVEVHGISILNQIINSLVDHGVTEILIVVGYLGKKIRSRFGNKYGKSNINYVENRDYSSTNSMYSLYLGIADLKDNNGRCWIVEGDIFSDPRMFDLPVSGDICWLVDSSKKNIDGAYLRVGKNGMARSLEIIRDTSLITFDQSKSTGIINVSAKGATDIKKFLVSAVANGETDVYYDTILRKHFKDTPVKVVDCSGIPWQEIDTISDLKSAIKLFE